MTEQCIEVQDKYDIWKYRNSLELMAGAPDQLTLITCCGLTNSQVLR